jgi:hypothetical protein
MEQSVRSLIVKADEEHPGEEEKKWRRYLSLQKRGAAQYLA